jgi:hypothetical protein
MKLIILPLDQFFAERKPFDLYIPEEEATDAFWSELDAAQAALREHLSQFGGEGTAWELPGHYQRCRVLYAYLYSESLYTPELLPGIVAAIPKNGKPWCAELECYTRPDPNSAPVSIGDLAIIDGTIYADSKDFLAYAEKLEIQVA